MTDQEQQTADMSAGSQLTEPCRCFHVSYTFGDQGRGQCFLSIGLDQRVTAKAVTDWCAQIADGIRDKGRYAGVVLIKFWHELESETPVEVTQSNTAQALADWQPLTEDAVEASGVTQDLVVAWLLDRGWYHRHGPGLRFASCPNVPTCYYLRGAINQCEPSAEHLTSIAHHYAMPPGELLRQVVAGAA